jgi:hypothetical protein
MLGLTHLEQVDQGLFFYTQLKYWLLHYPPGIQSCDLRDKGVCIFNRCNQWSPSSKEALNIQLVFKVAIILPLPKSCMAAAGSFILWHIIDKVV